MKRFLRVFLACGLLQAAAAADQGPLKLLPSPLEMPRRIGPLVTDGAGHAYEDPRLGVSYDYDGEGLLLSVYVYDAGVESIPDGADNRAVCEQFEEAKEGVVRAGYRDVTLKAEQMVRLAPPADSPQAREAVYELIRKDRPMISYVWITGVAKHFVKLRFTLDARLRDEAPEARRAVLDALGDAVRPHLHPVDAQAEKSGTSPGFNLGAAGSDDITAQFTYMLLLSALAEQPGQKEAPVCGGPFVPGFESDVAVMRQMIGLGKEDKPSKFAKALGSVDAAGLLPEFVWTELHREEWGDSPPAGLRLNDYKTWKKKNLKRFQRPKLGVVTIDHPRPMPLEPQ